MVRAALRRMMSRAQSAGLLEGSATALAEQFGSLLWGNTMVDLLLGVAERPSSREIVRRARDATVALLELNSPPSRGRQRASASIDASPAHARRVSRSASADRRSSTVRRSTGEE
jgi:hypothetical protein